LLARPVRIVVGVALLLTPLQPALVRGEDPEEVAMNIKITTPLYKPQYDVFTPPLGTYTYDVSWQGIPAAEVKSTVAREGNEYRVTTSVRTLSGIDLLYKLRHKSQSVFSVETLRPLRFTMEQRENSRDKTVDVDFSPDGPIHARRTSKGGQDRKELTLNTENFTVDPYTAAFVARSQPWSVGETKRFDTFNGKNRYIVELTAEGLQRLEVNGVMKDVWVVNPRVVNLSNNKPHEKLRKARIFVTADKQRDIVKVQSSVFIGTVTTELVSFEPLPPVADTAVAAVTARAKKVKLAS
jgi:hypothetical protein